MGCPHTRLISFVLSAAAAFAAPSAQDIFRAGERAERAGDRFQAYLLYARAATLEPANAQFLLRKNLLQQWANLAAQISVGEDPAGGEVARMALEGLGPSDVIGSRALLSAPHLAGTGEKKSFDLRGTARAVWEEVARAYGIQVEFENGYQGPTSAFTFRVADLSLEEALRALETVTNSFLVPVSEKRAIIYQDTAQRRTDFAPMVTALIPIPERISAQEAQEMVTAVQQLTEIRRTGVDPTRHLVLLRDVPSKVMVARQVLASLSRSRAQVEIEIELLALNRNSSQTYGLSLPNSTSIVNLGHFLNNNAASVAQLTRLATFGGGATLMGLGITDATAFATVSRSISQSVLDSTIVALDGQAVSFKVGDRYPIITSAYVGAQGVSGTEFAPAPSIQFTDLGIVLKITPTVHENEAVTIDVDAQQTAIAGPGVNEIPIISQRTYQGKTRLAAGEWAVVAGLVVNSVNRNTSGILGLASIPWIGNLFRKNEVIEQAGEILIVLKPRLVNLPPSEFPTPAVWVGTETKPLSVY